MEGRFGVSSRYDVFLEWQCMYIVRFAYFLYGADVEMLQVRGLKLQVLDILFSADRYGGVVAHTMFNAMFKDIIKCDYISVISTQGFVRDVAPNFSNGSGK